MNRYDVDSDRLSALTDGVVAIALTLLVLDLNVEDEPGDNVLADLVTLAPDFLGWIVSFILIGRVWKQLHTLSKHLDTAGRPMTVLMFLSLGCCSLIPFGSRVLDKHIEDPWAVVVFSAVMTLNGLALAAASFCAAWRHPPQDEAWARELRLHALHFVIVFPLTAVAASMLAFVHVPSVALLLWLSEPLVGWQVAEFLSRRRNRHAVA